MNHDNVFLYKFQELLNKFGNDKEKRKSTDIDYNYKIIVEGYPTETLKFDFQSFTFYDLIGLIKFYDKKIFNFDFVDKRNSSYGSGANRQIYLKMANDMVGDILKKKDDYFVDFDENNKFWSNFSNIKAFARFIYLLLNSKCILPFHLPPRYLEILSGYDISIEELEYFYEKLYPNALQKIEDRFKQNPSEFIKLDVGYNSYEQMLRGEVLNESDKVNVIYFELAEQQKNIFDYQTNIVTIDYVLSGTFGISSKIALDIFKIKCDLINLERYSALWNGFINKLNSNEIKQMLLLFSNSTAPKQTIYIFVKNDITVDIKIYTCMKEVYLNEKLFGNSETLLNLKMYFQNDDSLNEASFLIPRSSTNYDYGMGHYGLYNYVPIPNTNDEYSNIFKKFYTGATIIAPKKLITFADEFEESEDIYDSTTSVSSDQTANSISRINQKEKFNKALKEINKKENFQKKWDNNQTISRNKQIFERQPKKQFKQQKYNKKNFTKQPKKQIRQFKNHTSTKNFVRKR